MLLELLIYSMIEPKASNTVSNFSTIACTPYPSLWFWLIYVVLEIFWWFHLWSTFWYGLFWLFLVFYLILNISVPFPKTWFSFLSNMFAIFTGHFFLTTRSPCQTSLSHCGWYLCVTFYNTGWVGSAWTCWVLCNETVTMPLWTRAHLLLIRWGWKTRVPSQPM